MSANDTKNLSDDTIASYILTLRRIFVIEAMLAWEPNLKAGNYEPIGGEL